MQITLVVARFQTVKTQKPKKLTGRYLYGLVYGLIFEDINKQS